MSFEISVLCKDLKLVPVPVTGYLGTGTTRNLGIHYIHIHTLRKKAKLIDAIETGDVQAIL
jgi:hypothetical protein